MLTLALVICLGGGLPIGSSTMTAIADTDGDFDYSVDHGRATLMKYSGNAAKLVIPDQLGGYPVVSIAKSSFERCAKLTQITIPDGVISIGDSAFNKCSKLTSVTIPGSVTSIGNSAFSYTKLPAVHFQDGLTSIGDGAFFGCSKLTKVTFPDSLTTIGEHAFFQCGLTTVAIPHGMTSVGANAFSGCSKLTKLTIPDGVTSIGAGAFDGCSKLSEIILPDSVNIIGNDAFAACGMTTIRIPAAVASIGSGAFSGCAKLKSIEVSPENPTYVSAEGVLFDTDKKEIMAYPIARAGKTYIIPEDTKIIGDLAFFFSKLTAVTIPDSVASIGRYAFYGCSKLTAVNIPANVAEISAAAFGFKGDSPKKLVLTVTEGSYGAQYAEEYGIRHASAH